MSEIILNPDMSREEIINTCKENGCSSFETSFIVNSVGAVWPDAITLKNARNSFSLLNLFRGFTQAMSLSEMQHAFKAKRKKVNKISQNIYYALAGILVNPKEYFLNDAEEVNTEMLEEFKAAHDRDFKDYNLVPEFLMEVSTKVPFFMGYSLYISDYLPKLIRSDLKSPVLARKFMLGMVSYFSDMFPDKFFNMDEYLKE